MIGLRRAVALAILAAAALGAACRASQPAVQPEQRLTTYYAALRVQPDGALDVTEDFVFADAPDNQTFVRRVPLALFDRIDRIAWNNGGVDSHDLTSADRSGGLDVAIPVDWPAGGAHLELTYRVEGAIAVRGGRGLLTWPLLAQGHPFAIDAASIALILPDTMTSASDPQAPAAGWTASRTAHGWLFDASRVPSRSPVTMSAELGVDANAVAEPEWEALETRTRQLMPAFVSAALSILATGLGVIVMIRWQFSSSSPIGAPGARDVAAAARGLVVSAWVLIVSGVIGAAATWRWFTYFGAWPVTVPLSVALVGVAFFPEASRLRRARRQ
jgi:hypothetical protein